MPDWNPNFPQVLGFEWMPSHGRTNRVWSGAPGAIQRLPSTGANTIESLRLSGRIDPNLEAETRTLVDIYEGDAPNLDAALFEPVPLIPDSDVAINDWINGDGNQTDLFDYIGQNANHWPNVIDTRWIENKVGDQNYECTVDASRFDVGGDLENCRIGFVEVRTIMGTNSEFRKMRHRIRIGSNVFEPAGGGVRDVHAFGAIYTFWYGEINPATGLPWLPADIADFGIGGSSTLILRAFTANTLKFPRVFALRLRVHVIPTEDRVAVAAWRRPEDLASSQAGSSLLNVDTDALITVPGGTAGWAKESGKNYHFAWRQSVSPSLYGPINAADVRWNSLFQDLGSFGQPAGPVYPLHPNGDRPPPTDVLASSIRAYDHFGRFDGQFSGSFRRAYGIAMLDGLGDPDPDSQPYRLTLADLILLNDTFTVGQRVTMSGTDNYLGVRLVVIPPEAPAFGNLTVRVHRVSDGQQIGGSFTISAADARQLTGLRPVPGVSPVPSGLRYVEGILSAGATLVDATDYEIRVSTTSNPGREWVLFAPDTSLAPEAGFGGGVNGVVIDGVHHTDRSLVVNLTEQPEPPQNFAAAAFSVPISTFAAELTTVNHVGITWDQPTTSLGSNFDRYLLDRRVEGGRWSRIANISDELLTGFVDHECPRDTTVEYRIRIVGHDGQFSVAVLSGEFVLESSGRVLILTNNHIPDRELVHLYDKESSYPILSNDGTEVVQIHGTDRQVVFREIEDRGIGLSTRIAVNQVQALDRGGLSVFQPLVDLTRTMDVPYICTLDDRGTRILGHVSASNATQSQPQHIYEADLEIIPTHAESIAVDMANGMFALLADSGTERAETGFIDFTGATTLRWEWIGINLDWAGVAGNQDIAGVNAVGWFFRLFAGGEFRMFRDTTSTALANLSTLDGRESLRVDYTIATDIAVLYRFVDSAWSQIGTFDGTDTLTPSGSLTIVGNRSFVMQGKLEQFNMYVDGVLVADPKFHSLVPGQTSFTDGQGNNWSLVNGAEIVRLE